MTRSAVVLFSLLALTLCGVIQHDTRATETPQQKADRLRWWREGRFGMFIHWGPVSIKGTEISWSRGGDRRGIGGKGEIPVEVYDNLYKQFDPVHFDASEWVAIAQAAGMRYMVLTAKHCDGFCLWRSDVDAYSMAATPFGRDVCGELAGAAHASGMRIGWYYSPMDWRDPDCRTERNGIYLKKMQEHLRELLANYGRIDLLWFDNDGGPAPWDQARTYGLVRALQPGLIINDRLGLGSNEYSGAGRDDPYADYLTPEQRVGAFDTEHPWETCMTLGTQWSWKPDDRIKTYDECVRILVQCVTGDGNLLLDVGPMPDGRIEPRQVKVLKEIGSWLKEYGESVYGTRGGPFHSGTWGGSTRRGNVLYLHIAKWDAGVLTLPRLAAGIESVSVLTGGRAKITTETDRLLVRMPVEQQDRFDTIVRLELDRSADEMAPVEVPEKRSGIMKRVFVTLKTPPDTQFSARGARSLVDGIRGTTDRLDGRWLGFGGSDFEAVFDMGVERSVSRITVGCLQEQVSRIFFPRTCEVSVSTDGTEFMPAGRIVTGPPQEDAEIRSRDFSIRCEPALGRFVRVKAVNLRTCPAWHPAAGSKAWLLVDEVVIE